MTATKDTERSPLGTMATIAGVMLVTIGLVALFTGELNVAGVWILAVGLAATGVAGLVAPLRSGRRSSEVTSR